MLGSACARSKELGAAVHIVSAGYAGECMRKHSK